MPHVNESGHCTRCLTHLVDGREKLPCPEPKSVDPATPSLMHVEPDDRIVEPDDLYEATKPSR